MGRLWEPPFQSLLGFMIQKQRSPLTRETESFPIHFPQVSPSEYFLIPFLEECLSIFPSFITLAVSHLFAASSCYQHLFSILKAELRVSMSLQTLQDNKNITPWRLCLIQFF